MNWNSSTESISGKTVVEKMLLKKLLLDVAIRPDLAPVCGDLRRGHAAGVVGQVGVEAALVGEQQPEHEHRDEARHAEPGERRHDLVERPGREQGDDARSAAAR